MPKRTVEDAERTRAALLDAALTVFAERGFAATQLEDVAQRAHVTRGALYHHFRGKPELFRAVLDERWDAVMAPAAQAITPLTPPGAPSSPPEGSPDDRKSLEKNSFKDRQLFSVIRSGNERRTHARVRAFVSTFLHLIEVDARARALLRMVLSGDATLADGGGRGGPDPLGQWESALTGLLREGGAGDESPERAHALLAGLLGHAIWVGLRGTGESSVVALADLLCETALRRAS